MPGVLEVHLNRDGPHAIEVGSPSFVAEGAFDVVLHNHGSSLHVHLHLDDALSRAASLGTANHYVDEGTVRRVTVAVDESRLPVEGRLEIVTGYGSETEYVSVTIREPGDTKPDVIVDERLGKPRPRQEPSSGFVDPDDLPVIALGAVALAIVLVVMLTIREPVVLVGVLVVLAGLAVAGLLLRGSVG